MKLMNFFKGQFFLHALFCCFIISCSPKAGKETEKITTVENIKLPWIEATVIDYSEIAGCGFILMLDDESKLQPGKLSNEFCKDGLKVLVQYQIQDKPNICQTGKVIQLFEIKVKQ